MSGLFPVHTALPALCKKPTQGEKVLHSKPWRAATWIHQKSEILPVYMAPFSDPWTQAGYVKHAGITPRAVCISHCLASPVEEELRLFKRVLLEEKAKQEVWRVLGGIPGCFILPALIKEPKAMKETSQGCACWRAACWQGVIAKQLLKALKNLISSIPSKSAWNIA